MPRFLPDALFSRSLSAMGEAAKASKIIAAETPRLTANVDQISSDVTREADSLTRPQSFWASIRAWFVALAKIYGAL